MAPLKSLEMAHPILDSNFQKFCASHGIFSVEDFLIHDIYELVAFAEQQYTSERLKQGITQVLSIIDHQHQPWLHGLELVEDTELNKHVVPTGCEWIDSFLQGGLRIGQLTELVGPSSSGKTQVCLQATSYVAKKRIGCVIYIDTGNSFSPQYIAQLVGLISDPTPGKASCDNLQTIMSRISCCSVFDIFSLFDALHQLDYKLRSQVQGDQDVRLLVVDSVSALITPILGGSGSQGHALMTSAGYLLKKLAHDHNVAVLVTNHTVGGEGGNPKPALGESWKSIPHVRILLSRDQRSNTFCVSLLKHPSIRSKPSLCQYCRTIIRAAYGLQLLCKVEPESVLNQSYKANRNNIKTEGMMIPRFLVESKVHDKVGLNYRMNLRPKYRI